MQYLVGFFVFLIVMATFESYGLLPYVYAAFWIAVAGVAFTFIPRHLRQHFWTSLVSNVRRRLDLPDYSSLPAEKHPLYEARNALPYAAAGVGILVLLQYCSYVGGVPAIPPDDLSTHSGTKQFLFVWLPLTAIGVPAIAFATYYLYSYFRRLRDALDWRVDNDARTADLEAKRKTFVAEMRSLLDRLLPPAGPFAANAYDLFPRDRFGAVAQLASEAGTPIKIPIELDENTLTVRDFAEHYIPNSDVSRMLLSNRSFGFTDDDRFRHQFIVGPTGSGKTTFISTQIADDLQRVARNEASLFIMDSQNELIPDIARLDVFSSDGPLAGKLIYLEPDPDYPLALNIFDINKERVATLSSKERMMLEAGAMWMVDFFLASLVKAEASAHQDTFLNYLIPALMQIPDATIFTLKELLDPPRSKAERPPGYEKYKPYFSHLRPDHQRWLADRMHSPELAVTRNAIRTRLDGFTARAFFHDMFANPRNKLDLFAELQSSKVILVNTMKGLLKGGTEPFGRFFLARLLQATEERMLLDRGSRLPVFAYIDEAGDYIREEHNIAELVDKARKQYVALTFSVQRTTDINSNVLDALQRAAIQCQGHQAPDWNVAVRGRAPIPVSVPDVRFQRLPQMSDSEYLSMLQSMHARYCTTATTHEDASRPNDADSRASLAWPDEEPTQPAKY